MIFKSLQSSQIIPACFLWAGLLLHIDTAYAQTGNYVWADTLQIKTLLDSCVLLNHAEQQEAALEKARQALVITTGLYGENHVKTAEVRTFVAYEVWTHRKDEEASNLFQQSYDTYEAIRDTANMAFCLNYLSKCRRNQRRYAEAQRHARAAIQLIRADSARLAFHLATYKQTLAYALNEEKNYLAAIPLLEEVKAAFGMLNKYNPLGVVSYHLGGAYFGLHDFIRAKENYLAAMDYLLKSGLPSNHSYFADLRTNIGICCQKSGDPGLGLTYMLQAKAAYEQKFEADDPRYLGFLQQLGEFYLDERQYVVAAEQFKTCLYAKEKRLGNRSHYLLPTLRALGTSLVETGQFVLAETYYRRGLQIAIDSLGFNHKFTHHFFRDLAALYLEQDDYVRSLIHCDSAFLAAGFNPDYPDQMVPRDYFRELCQLYARSLMGRFQQNADTALLVQAERYFAIAGESLYREVEEVAVHSSREIFYDRDFTVLEQWLAARMLLYNTTGKAVHAEKAFQIAGQSKAFLLSQAMRRSGALRYAGVPDSIIQHELSLRERIVGAEKSLEMSGNEKRSRLDASTLSQSTGLSQWRKDYDVLLRSIENKYPDYFKLRLLRADVSTVDLRHKWLVSGQALLMYTLTDRFLYLFVLTRDTFCINTITVDDSLTIALKNYRNSLTEYYLSPDPGDALYDLNLEKYITLSQFLYRKLLLPVAPLLPERVIIIPDGKLCYLPFESLLTEAPADIGNFRSYPFWASEKAVSYALSTDFLVETSVPSGLKPEKKWLGIAPFAGNPDSEHHASRTVSNEHFASLPFSGREVKGVAELLEGEAWLGTDAAPGRFRREAARYQLLHLATHSRADDRLGDYSWIATSDTATPLPAKDLYLFSLNADMVVLSACEAGGGKLLRGEGIIGLVRAFTYAGARSIVASLWVANDQSTASLMVDFYRNLRKGMHKDVALKMARINTLNQSPAAAHPFFWAGFRIYGNVRALW